MPLSPGVHIGPYEIVELIGEGGMGQVYRARDAKLNRDVALKVLPDLLDDDPDRLARFQREAQVLGALNHPNIAHIHGFEDSGDTHAIVMELVEGVDLSHRIAQGAMPIEDVLPIARQIAEAFEAAHELGIIHRDLKPANVKVRDDGVVKVLDFGLAKALAPDSGPGTQDSNNSPTLTARATQMGTILGTAAYMAPEQAKGRAVDKRADIWAFGVVVYEMLTGERCFKGEDISDTLAAVLRQDVDWAALPADTPPRLRRLLERCLDRNAKQRLRDIGEARVEIEKIEAGAPDASVMIAAGDVSTSAPARAPALPWAVAGAAVIAFVAALAMWAPWTQVPPAQSMHLQITPTVDLPFEASDWERSLAISPDGTHVAYVSGPDRQLVVRAVNSLVAEPLSGISGARQPFFSPDGKWVGFAQVAAGVEPDLRKVMVTGGPPITISKMFGPPRGASWGEDDTIVFATAARQTGLYAVSAGGDGEPKEITRIEAAGDHLFPAILPGGRAVVFTIGSPTPGDEQVAVLDLTTGQHKTLIRGGSQATYVGSFDAAQDTPEGPGYLVYGVSGTLRAVSFDLETLETQGDPVPVVDHVSMGRVGSAQFAASRTGALIYVPGTNMAISRSSFVWTDRQGHELPSNTPLGMYGGLRLSPDGTRVAVTGNIIEGSGILIWDIRREIMTTLTSNTADSDPVWTPDNQHIVFRSDRGSGPNQLFWQAADGTGQVDQLPTSAAAAYSFVPDGSQLLVSQSPGEGDLADIYVLSMDTRESQPLIERPGIQRNAAVSPDGQFVAYQSSESGRFEIIVRPFPDVSGGRWQISANGGSQPSWSRDSKELFYVSAGELHAVSITAEPSLRAGSSETLFPLPGVGVGRFGRPYDVSNDGERFIVLKDEPDATAPETPNAEQLSFVFVVNWIEELRRAVR